MTIVELVQLQIGPGLHKRMASAPVWRICLGQLGPNLQEAAELADVLQEVSAHIQVRQLTGPVSTPEQQPDNGSLLPCHRSPA